jgi:hypothetical protein
MTSASFNRPGAVDLSALKQKAQQSAGPAGPGQGGSYVVEVTEQTFEAETIRRSVKHPVVVELYSPRVPTGHQLSDILAEIANSSGGKFLLARLNVDTAPGIVQALGLQAVPTVIALIGGQVAPARAGTTVVVLSGGNVDAGLLATVARRHESEAGRRVVLYARVPDRPGSLARLLSLVGETGANLVDVEHLREGVDLHVRETGVQLVLETRSREHAADVLRAVTEAGYEARTWH